MGVCCPEVHCQFPGEMPSWAASWGTETWSSLGRKSSSRVGSTHFPRLSNLRDYPAQPPASKSKIPQSPSTQSAQAQTLPWGQWVFSWGLCVPGNNYSPVCSEEAWHRMWQRRREEAGSKERGRELWMAPLVLSTPFVYAKDPVAMSGDGGLGWDPLGLCCSSL